MAHNWSPSLCWKLLINGFTCLVIYTALSHCAGLWQTTHHCGDSFSKTWLLTTNHSPLTRKGADDFTWPLAYQNKQGKPLAKKSHSGSRSKLLSSRTYCPQKEKSHSWWKPNNARKNKMNKMVVRDTGGEMETFHFQAIWLVNAWMTPHMMMQKSV